MNILFIANHINVGGISSYLFTLASGLIGHGHNVYLASSGGELSGKFTAAGVKLIEIPLRTKKEVSPKIIVSFLKLRKEVKKYNIDLIHSNSRTTQVLGNLLSRYCRKPHIFTCHGFFKPKLSRKLFPCWGNLVIAISQEVKEHLISDFKLDEKMVRVINNGIDLQGFGDFSGRQGFRESLGIGNIPLVGIVARLSDVKGHTYLFKAMPNVLKSFPSVKLLVVGEGKMKGVLIKEADDLAIKDSVLFLAQVGGTENVLAGLDVFVMPSLQEGLGLALMEAMAQGLAVVGSAVGGIKTLIKDGQNGLLIMPADPVSLAEAIKRLLADKQLRDNLGASARKFIMDNFSKEKMVDETEKVYRDV
ncbi:MAG: glycosyltransferase family 4 protein [Candidatus Omnitrophica bacterium]|jgi:glycosyltransferase involved in cell wall biosynthesis|nr:glycosyltransferase family 4 protein [Candidatus Omnitrophota bacterium]MDD5252591.1 glycosyltransferase family 4 protein [Candidatus Omnitrophota bacterium]